VSDHEFHSGAQPMAHMQGGMFEPYHQHPSEVPAMENSRPQASTSVDTPWTAGLASKPGMNPANSNPTH
jgi:hypothetical protein